MQPGCPCQAACRNAQQHGVPLPPVRHERLLAAPLGGGADVGVSAVRDRRGKLHSALKFLEKAVKLEQGLIDLDDPASTHLNLCATLSEMDRCEEPILRAVRSVFC